jgi:hypothetical protein
VRSSWRLHCHCTLSCDRLLLPACDDTAAKVGGGHPSSAFFVCAVGSGGGGVGVVGVRVRARVGTGEVRTAALSGMICFGADSEQTFCVSRELLKSDVCNFQIFPCRMARIKNLKRACGRQQQFTAAHTAVRCSRTPN